MSRALGPARVGQLGSAPTLLRLPLWRGLHTQARTHKNGLAQAAYET